MKIGAQKHFWALPVVLLLSACSGGDVARTADGIHDPYEKNNRAIHRFNVKLDRAILRPTAQGYTSIIPDEIEDSIGNFATNLGQPSVMVNSILQGDIKGASLSGTRFLTNTILGFGGFVDAASELNVPDHSTDFGETLYRWGVGEGPFVELPLLGASTVRNSTGKFVDLFTNPLTYIAPSPEKYYGTAASAASRLSDRGRYSETIDSILYDSADSYAQARLIYLQNRRFALGDASNESTDQYSDPYEDPYAQ